MSVQREILGRCRPPARLVAIGLLLGLLAACGQKGPLYLPEKPAQDSKTPTPAR